jgi:hypothetical protein
LVEDSLGEENAVEEAELLGELTAVVEGEGAKKRH